MRLTHEHEQVRDTVRRWIAEQVNPHVDTWEETGTFPARFVAITLVIIIPPFGLCGLARARFADLQRLSADLFAVQSGDRRAGVVIVAEIGKTESLGVGELAVDDDPEHESWQILRAE